MYSWHPDAIRRLLELQTQEYLRQAALERLTRESESGERGPLLRHGRRLVHHVGRLLVTLGRWLERFDSPAVAAHSRLPRAQP